MSFFESIFYMAWRGIAIGLIISAPMGPVGMLCIQRTLDKGRRAGFYTGIGAAISDLLYSLLTGFGLSFIEEFLERNQNIIQLAGSAVLIGFGIYLFKKNPSKGLKKPADDNISVKKSILGGFLFTFSNPLILFLTVGLFARFNFLLPEFHAWQYFTGFAFIFVGAIIWWWFITFSVDKVRSHFNIRSMWLINKIIGIIILLFAVVGIFTAVSALAQGTDVRNWNGRRGLGPFAGSEESGRLSNDSPDTLVVMVPCYGAHELEFRFKVRNPKPSNGWGIVLDGSGSRLYMDVRASETDFDGVSTAPALEIETHTDASWPFIPSKKSFTDNTDIFKRVKSGMSGPDPTGALNFFKVTTNGDMLTLSGGLHSPEMLLSAALPEGFQADSIGFYLSPGCALIFDDMRLAAECTYSIETPWTDTELLDNYLSQSHDRMEGYWQTLDRSLDETLLRLGGDYRYAMVKSEDGYDLVYLSGAKINAGNWSPGMLKARLRPSGIKGVWDVVWMDAMHRPMDNELKAQTDQNGTLTIQFPYQDSQLRLHHSETQARP